MKNALLKTYNLNVKAKLKKKSAQNFFTEPTMPRHEYSATWLFCEISGRISKCVRCGIKDQRKDVLIVGARQNYHDGIYDSISV